MLVGEKLDAKANDSTVIRGMLVAGLRKVSGQNARKTKFRKDPVRIYYNSCTIKRAMEPLRGLAPLRNAWVDNWASY